MNNYQDIDTKLLEPGVSKVWVDTKTTFIPVIRYKGFPYMKFEQEQFNSEHEAMDFAIDRTDEIIFRAITSTQS